MGKDLFYNVFATILYLVSKLLQPAMHPIPPRDSISQPEFSLFIMSISSLAISEISDEALVFFLGALITRIS